MKRISLAAVLVLSLLASSPSSASNSNPIKTITAVSPTRLKKARIAAEGLFKQGKNLSEVVLELKGKGFVNGSIIARSIKKSRFKHGKTLLKAMKQAGYPVAEVTRATLALGHTETRMVLRLLNKTGYNLSSITRAFMDLKYSSLNKMLVALRLERLGPEAVVKVWKQLNQSVILGPTIGMAMAKAGYDLITILKAQKLYRMYRYRTLITAGFSPKSIARAFYQLHIKSGLSNSTALANTVSFLNQGDVLAGNIAKLILPLVKNGSLGVAIALKNGLKDEKKTVYLKKVVIGLKSIGLTRSEIIAKVMRKAGFSTWEISTGLKLTGMALPEGIK